MKPKWIVRIVAGVVLLALLALAGVDYLAKSQASETAAALLAEMDSNKVELDLEHHLVGSPDLDIQTLTKTEEKLVYTWSGVIRDYRVEVECIGPADKDGKRFVKRVEGPLSD
ncbi:MAG: hypothetical protein ACE37H_06440 [Phycisphaeraceae bacterium]